MEVPDAGAVPAASTISYGGLVLPIGLLLGLWGKATVRVDGGDIGSTARAETELRPGLAHRDGTADHKGQRQRAGNCTSSRRLIGDLTRGRGT